MCHESGVECLCEEVCATSVRNISIRWMVLEEVGFGLEGILHGLVPLDILLRAVDNANESQLQGIDAARENIESVGTMIHQVNFGQDADSTSAERINMTGKFEGLGVDQIHVGRGHGENDAVGLRDIFGYQITSLLLNIGRLVTNRNL